MSMDVDVYCLHGHPADFRIGLVIEANDRRGCKGQAFNLAKSQPWIT